MVLAKLTMNEIESLRKRKKFYCPICNEEVIIKAGTQVTPHFAHRSKINCPSNSKGESSYHEKGKWLLYQWLKKQNLQVNLELLISPIDQRPDLLLMINDKKIAIEFQCTRIGIDQIQKRNEGYKKMGIQPIWILGANFFKRQTNSCLKMNAFILQFIHQFSSKTTLKLYYFCPKTLQFTICQQLYMIRKRIAFSQFHFTSLSKLKFTDLFVEQTFSKKQLYVKWKKEKIKFRLQPRKQIYGKERSWYQWLYLKRTHIDNLPSIIHLPIRSQYQMKTSLWDWQSRLCIDLLGPLPIGQAFSVRTCQSIIRNAFHPSDHFPLIQSFENPITEYLQLLATINIVKQISSTQFIKMKSIQFYNHIEEALKGDIVIMDQLLANLTDNM